jgi:putative selenium metabolism protein SsnA
MKAGAATNFQQILETLWWKLDKQLDDETIYYSAVAELIESIKQGTTCFIDHHSSPGCISGSLDILQKAVSDFGVRGCLCYEVTDRNGADSIDEGIEENIRYISKTNRNSSTFLRGMFGIHASFTVSDNTLERCVASARELGVGCHLHCCEGTIDNEDAKTKGYDSVVQRLNQFEVLGPATILAHGIHLSQSDLNTIAQRESIIIHNPYSNFNNTVGIAPVREMLEKGIKVGLGTDGWTDGMMYQARMALLAAKTRSNDPSAGFLDSLKLLFENNPRIASKLFNEQLGDIVVGAAADLVTLDYMSPTPVNADNTLSHLVYGLTHVKVNSVICGGKLILKDGKLTMLDEEKLLYNSRKAAERLWFKF